MSDITVNGRMGVNLWRAIRNIADGGSVPLIVPRHEIGSAPWPTIDGVEVRSVESLSHTDGTFFSDGTGYEQPVISAITVGSVLLRSTSLRIQILQGGPLIGGEVFSILHLNKGWRMYEISTVEQNEDLSYNVTFLPPLREAVADGEDIEFDAPRCVMRLETSESMDLEVSNPWYGKPTVSFVESFHGV